MKNHLLLFIPFLIINFLFGKTMDVRIVPAPKIINFQSGEFQLRNNLSISVPFEDKENAYTVELLQQTLKEFNKINCSFKDEADIQLNFIGSEEENHIIKNLNDEGYVLRILENKIELQAKTPKGIHFAAMSLIQMLEKADKSLPCVEIIDWPDMSIRGISDDISRGQVSTLTNFKRIISHIARYKMNTYMPYLEDMLVFDKYPSIGKGRGALTKNEVKEIVEFAKKNFVEVIPIFQTLGHYENILSQEEFLKYAEFPGAASLNVSSDATYVFLEDLLKEVFELFPSQYFHMGADESWDVGLGESKKLVEESNIAAVHANHYKKVYNICKKYNKKVMMYGDILLDHPEILSLIPKDIIIVDWHYRAQEEYSSTKILHEAGFNYIVSPASWNFLTTFPANINSIPNIQYITKSGLDNESIGMINSNWGDYGAETFKEFILYNYAWSAQCSWNFTGSDLGKFNKDYFYDFFGVDDEKSANIYNTLGDPLNQFLWHEIWRHPMLNFREPAWWEPRISKAAKISWNELTLAQINDDINNLEPIVRKNSDHFDLLKFIMNLNNWYKLKVETQILIQSLLEDKSSTSFNKLINLIDKNIASLSELKNDFRKLWLTYYKEANLKLIEDKFNRLIAYFNEIKENILENTFYSYNPLLDSEWLYVPEDNSTYSPKAEFVGKFNLEEEPQEAYLQLMGDSYAQLTINDKPVTKVFVRASLSLTTEYKRIKLVDIKPYLRKGENSFYITAESFRQDNGGGFNLIAEIKTSKGKVILKSDDSNESNITWQGRKKDDKLWNNVVSKNRNLEIIAPNFETKRTSWIER
jgi:hypothetical protein